MGSKHAPRPWQWVGGPHYTDEAPKAPDWDYVGYGEHPVMIDAEGSIVVCAGNGEYRPCSREIGALLAAAPDLLAALESALQTLEYLRDCHPDTSGRGKHMDDIDRARAAIARARGE